MSATSFYSYFLAASRWAGAVLCLLLVVTWLRYYFSARGGRQVFAELLTPDGRSLPVRFLESVLGRGGRADLVIPSAGVKRRHAVLYADDGQWILAPAEGRVAVNRQNLSQPAPVYYGDKITIGGCTLTFKQHRTVEDISSKKPAGPVPCLWLLTAFQLLLGVQIWLFSGTVKTVPVYAPVLFLGLAALQWVYYLVGRRLKGFKMLMELPVFYLASLGLTLCCCDFPKRLSKQVLCFLAGLLGYLLFTLLLKRFPARIVLQRLVMAGSLALLYLTALFGSEINSSRNWLVIGPVSFQPSELCKAAFIFAGCAALYTVVLRKGRQLEFTLYAVLCMGALALMLDFGAVAIFFVGMLTLLCLRLVSPWVTGGICVLFGGAGITVLAVYPYIARRFAVWLHAWQYADSTGYQQTRTMIASASGGLLGVGPGNGYLSAVSAAETDLVFGVVFEELGGIIALVAALCFVALGVYAYRLGKNASSLFYTCGVCTAAVMLLFQSALNIFGSLDLLPLTGVTLIFVSCGGTSVIAAWLMLAFFKAAELAHPPVDGWREYE